MSNRHPKQQLILYLILFTQLFLYVFHDLMYGNYHYFKFLFILFTLNGLYLFVYETFNFSLFYLFSNFFMCIVKITFIIARKEIM